MRITATQVLWREYGELARPGGKLERATGPCWQCGLECGGSAYAVAEVIPTKTFTGWAFVGAPHSPWICRACAWVVAGNGAASVRGWHVVYREDGDFKPYVPTVKDDPSTQGKPAMWHTPRALLTKRVPEIIELLAAPPKCAWFVSISQTGKCHTMPYTPMNHGDIAWTVRFERNNVSSTPALFKSLLHHAAALNQAGISRDEIVSGNYSPVALSKCIPQLSAHAPWLRGWHNSDLLTMVCFLLRKDNVDALATA